MLTLYFESTPQAWAVHFDPEGPIWRGKTKLAAIQEMLCDDDPDASLRVAEEVLELVGIAEEAEATTKRYAAYISPEEHAMALSKGAKWTPTSDLMPEDSRTVLIYIIDSMDGVDPSMEVGYWNGMSWFCASGMIAARYKITHWKQLPEAPK